MTITSYNQFSAGSYEGLVSRIHPVTRRNFLSAKLFQQSTVTVVTGDATTGWLLTVTNSTTGVIHTLLFDPVDSAGAPSAVAADAAATLHREWNANTELFLVARASLAAAVVTFDFKNTEDYTVVTTEAGAGAATDALVSAGGGVRAQVGRWQFFDSTAAVVAGESPIIVSALSQTALLNIAGVAERANHMEQDPNLQHDAWRLGADVSCVRMGQITVRVIAAVTIASAVHIVTGAGVDLGLTAASGGLNISAFAKFSRSAAAGELVEVWYDLQTAR